MSEISRMLRASLLQRSREMNGEPVGAAIYSFRTRQPRPTLHPMTENMILGTLGAFDQFLEDIEDANSEAEVWELNQWMKDLQEKVLALVDASADRLNEFGAREVK